MVEYLIEQKTDLNLLDKNSHNNLSIHDACNNPNVTIEIIKKMVENGADFLKKNKKNETPLFLACKNAKPNKYVINYLLESKSSIKNTASTYLEVLIKNNEIDIELLEYLKKKETIVPSNFFFNKDPLLLFCKHEKINTQIIDFLLQNKSSINFRCNKDDLLPIELALNNVHSDINIIKHFMKNKSHINLDSCLSHHFSIPKQNLQIIKLLIRNKAKLSYQTKFFNNPIDNMLKKNQIDPQIVDYLIEIKIDINFLDFQGHNYLFLASSNPLLSYSSLKYLIEKKISLTQQNFLKHSAIQNLITTSREDIFKTMLSLQE